LVSRRVVCRWADHMAGSPAVGAASGHRPMSREHLEGEERQLARIARALEGYDDDEGRLPLERIAGALEGILEVLRPAPRAVCGAKPLGYDVSCVLSPGHPTQHRTDQGAGWTRR
jgi:hypothetical protein